MYKNNQPQLSKHEISAEDNFYRLVFCWIIVGSTVANELIISIFLRVANYNNTG